MDKRKAILSNIKSVILKEETFDQCVKQSLIFDEVISTIETVDIFVSGMRISTVEKILAVVKKYPEYRTGEIVGRTLRLHFKFKK